MTDQAISSVAFEQVKGSHIKARAVASVAGTAQDLQSYPRSLHYPSLTVAGQGRVIRLAGDAEQAETRLRLLARHSVLAQPPADVGDPCSREAAARADGLKETVHRVRTLKCGDRVRRDMNLFVEGSVLRVRLMTAEAAASDSFPSLRSPRTLMIPSSEPPPKRTLAASRGGSSGRGSPPSGSGPRPEGGSRS